MKSKLLIIPGYNVYPFSNGSSVAQMSLLEQLSKSFDITLFLTKLNIENKDLDKFHSVFPFLKLHYFDGLADDDFFTLKSKLYHYFRIFIRLILSGDKLNHIIVHNPYQYKTSLVKGINEFLSENKFDIVQIELLVNLNLIKYIKVDSKRIFVNHEVLSERLTTELDALNLGMTLLYRIESWICKRQETRLMNFFDMVFCFSEKDKLGILANGYKNDIFITPYGLLEDNVQIIKHSGKTNKLLFLGSESHLPNQHGLKWFLDEVYRSYNIKIPLYVTGAWSDKFQNSVKNSNVKFVGFVENLDTLLMDAILVSPIFIGAGLRTKILLAMSRGVPVVSSSFSCNGICVENNKNILLADSGEEFHKSINLLVSNTDYYLDVSENAYDLIKEEFNKEVLAGKRRSCYQKIL